MRAGQTINCIHNDDTLYCINKEVKRSLFGIGPRFCLEYGGIVQCPHREGFLSPKVNDIKTALVSLANSFDKELFSKKEWEVEKSYWYFKYDPNKTLEVNIYEFSKAIESYREICRNWAEHYFGSCCVVERVRDHFLIPKINEFAANVKEQLVPFKSDLKAWKVTVEGMGAIVFALTRSKAKWLSVRAYWEAYNKDGWPSVTIKREPKYDNHQLMKQGPKAWDGDFVKKMD
jgi:hypothetical protein